MEKKVSYQVSPDIFFLVEDGKILLWNCRTHQQYFIDKRLFEEIINLTQGGATSRTYISYLKKVGAGVSVNYELAWKWDIVSRLFHYGTRDVPTSDFCYDPTEFSKCFLKENTAIVNKMPSLFQEKYTAIYNLPQPQKEFSSYGFCETLYERKTCRDFIGQFTDIGNVSNIMYSVFGLIEDQWEELKNKKITVAGIRKTTPSSGGLHAGEAYLVAFRVNGLPPGIYYYRPQDHKLNLIQEGELEDKIVAINNKQFYSKGLAFGVYLTARLDKYWWKYKHSRAYRAMLMDIGHLSQTFLLCATAAGLDTWITGAFSDEDVERLLNVDGETEPALLFLGAGYGTGNSFPRGSLPEKQMIF